jgi:hypothetical protein
LTVGIKHTIIWTIFAAKESSGGSIDGTVPGGGVSAVIDPVKASIAVFP